MSQQVIVVLRMSTRDIGETEPVKVFQDEAMARIYCQAKNEVRDHFYHLYFPLDVE